jgi:DNA-binding GntR family transcriptional regulator
MLMSLLDDASSLSSKPVYRALTDWVVLKMLDGVRKGEFVPDQRLSEQDLAKRFDVSRAPVRDALHRLEQIGVAERRPPRGMYVRSWTDADHAEVHSLVDALNLLAVQLSFGRLTEDDFAQLERILGEASRATETGIEEDRRQIQRDSDFHLIIARASGNRRLVQLMEQLMLPGVLYVTEAHDYLQRDFWLQIHGGLLEAMRSGNLEQSEARSIANARKIRELMFEHNGHVAAEAGPSPTDQGRPQVQQVPMDEPPVELPGKSAALQNNDQLHP